MILMGACDHLHSTKIDYTAVVQPALEVFDGLLLSR